MVPTTVRVLLCGYLCIEMRDYVDYYLIAKLF